MHLVSSKFSVENELNFITVQFQIVVTECGIVSNKSPKYAENF